jgi:hypothetical protein
VAARYTSHSHSLEGLEGREGRIRKEVLRALEKGCAQGVFGCLHGWIVELPGKRPAPLQLCFPCKNGKTLAGVGNCKFGAERQKSLNGTTAHSSPEAHGWLKGSIRATGLVTLQGLATG